MAHLKLVHSQDKHAKALGKQLAGTKYTLSIGAVAKISGVPIHEIRDHDSNDQDPYIPMDFIEFLDMVEAMHEALESISNTTLSDLSDGEKLEIIGSLTRLGLIKADGIIKSNRLTDARSRRIKELENALSAIKLHLSATVTYFEAKNLEIPACLGAAQTTIEGAFANRRQAQKQFLGGE